MTRYKPNDIKTFFVLYAMITIYLWSWMPHLMVMQTMGIQIGITALIAAATFLKCKRQPFISIFLVLLCIALMFRIFRGPFVYDSALDKVPTLDVRIISFEGSPRMNFVQKWISKTSLPEPFLDLSDLPTKDYSSELGFTKGCSNTTDADLRTEKLSYLIKRLFETYDSKSEWLLLLEDDAKPIWLDSFDDDIKYLLPRIERYDYVSLDVRAMAGFNMHLSNTMCCTAAVLFQVKSLKALAREIRLKESLACNRNYDLMIGEGCASGRISCLVVPLVMENGFRSTLRSIIF